MKFLITLSLLILVLASCNDNYKSNPIANNDASNSNSRSEERGGGNAGEDTGIYFDRDITPILKEKCASCHGPSSSKNWTNYKIVVENAPHILGSINHEASYKKMPMGGRKLPAETIKLIKDWIDTGMEEMAPVSDTVPVPAPTPEEPVPAPEEPTPNLVNIGEKIYVKSCANCHNSPVAFPKLAGQKEAYIITELEHFKSKRRLDPTMNYIVEAKLQDDKNIEFIAKYISELDPCSVPSVEVEVGLDPDDQKPNAAAGKAMFDNQCAGCHNAASANPVLDGQNPNYLLKTLTALKAGDRPSTLMNVILTNVSRQQMINISTYLNKKNECN